MLRRGLAPASFVIGTAVVTWLVSGVAVLDIVKFLGYEVAFVLVPGAAVLWAVRGRRSGRLLMVAIGWPLGQALEILAFSATAEFGSRGLFILYPPVAVVVSALVIWKRARDELPSPSSLAISRRLMWTAAGTLSLGLVYLAVMWLPMVPMPSVTESIRYDPDYPYFIGLIAEVLNHWPATNPGLAGVPWHYEWFIFFHMAAISQVTHLAIATVAFRLDYVPTMVVIGCQLLAVGRSLGRAAWAGVVAIAVFFLLGPLDLTTDPSGPTPFGDRFTYHLFGSWTFAFGVMFFLALLYLINERVQAATWRTRDDVRSWLLITILMVGASGSKATILPVIVTGTGLYFGSVLLLKRQASKPAAVTLGLGIGIFIMTFYVVYGGGVPGTTIQPFAWLAGTFPVLAAGGITNHPTLRMILLPLAYAAGLAGVMLPVSGMLYLLRRRHRAEITPFALCLCLFGGGLLIGTVVHQRSYGEEFFVDTGYVAGCVVAAAGLRLAWLDAGHFLPISKRSVAIAFSAWLALLLAIVAITSRSVAHENALVIRYVVLGAGGVAFVVAFGVWLRAHHRSVSGLLALGLIPLVAASALTLPIVQSPTLERVLRAEPVSPTQPDPQTVWGLTPNLLIALQWLKDHTSTRTVFAVNNHWIEPTKTNGKYYYYTAFSERQVFVEAYDGNRYGVIAGITTPISVNYAYREELNDEVFNDADRIALRILMGQYSVRFLFIDRIHGPFDPNVLQLGRVVYSNDQAFVIAVG
jgi:hypothetical protein